MFTKLNTNIYAIFVIWKWKKVKVKVAQSYLTLCNPSPWNSPGQNTGVSSLSLLQGIFPTQGSNPGLPQCRRILYQLSHKGSPRILEWVTYHFSSRSSQPRNQTRVFCIAGGFFTNWDIWKAHICHIYILMVLSLLAFTLILFYFIIVCVFSFHYYFYYFLYCSGFCHTLTWISHGFTCIPHPYPPSHLPPDPIPLGLPSAPALSTCLMYPIWACDFFHHR